MANSINHAEGLDRILELVILVHDDMTTSLARDGLTESRVRVVWELRRLGPMTQKSLADAIGVSARNITGLVDALATTGFATRKPHPTDRRAILVSLTEHGTRVADELVTGQGEFASLLFSGMPAKQFNNFVATMDDILGSLRGVVVTS